MSEQVDKGLEFREWARQGVECEKDPPCPDCARMLAIVAAVQAPTSDDLYTAAMSKTTELSNAIFSSISLEMSLHIEAAIALASWAFHRPGTRNSDKAAVTALLAEVIDLVSQRNRLLIVQVPLTLSVPKVEEGKTH